MRQSRSQLRLGLAELVAFVGLVEERRQFRLCFRHFLVQAGTLLVHLSGDLGSLCLNPV